LEASEDFGVLEQFGFSGMSANSVDSIKIHGALLRCRAARQLFNTTAMLVALTVNR